MITAVDPNTDKYPNSRARIYYDNLLVNSSLSAAAKVLTKNTFERYIPTSSGIAVTLSLSSAATCDYVAVGASSLSVGMTIEVRVAATIGGAQTLVGTFAAIDDAQVIRFDNQTVAEVIITPIYAGVAGEIGVIQAGLSLEVAQPIYGGHSPLSLSAKTSYTNAKTINGNFIGRTIEQQGNVSSFSWRHLPSDWYRSTFQPFVKYANKYPFFIQWRPDYHSEEISYCWTTKDVKPSNMGMATTLMQVTVSVEAYDGV